MNNLNKNLSLGLNVLFFQYLDCWKCHVDIPRATRFHPTPIIPTKYSTLPVLFNMFLSRAIFLSCSSFAVCGGSIWVLLLHFASWAVGNACVNDIFTLYALARKPFGSRSYLCV